MKQTAMYLLVISSVFLSCKKSNSSGENSLEFGVSYGECINDCASFYRIADGKLYVDSMLSRNFEEKLLFKSTPLTQEKYLIARELENNFPVYLESNPEKRFGCPDCFDQGAIFIKRSKRGVIRTWNIDPTDHLDEIAPFVQQIISTLQQLKG